MFSSCTPIPRCIAPQIRLNGLGGNSDGALANADGFQIAALGELAEYRDLAVIDLGGVFAHDRFLLTNKSRPEGAYPSGLYEYNM